MHITKNFCIGLLSVRTVSNCCLSLLVGFENVLENRYDSPVKSWWNFFISKSVGTLRICLVMCIVACLL